MGSSLINYLEFIKKQLNAEVCIKDVTGFLSQLDKQFSLSLIPYMLHTNPFCVYMKSHPEICKTCSDHTLLIYNKLLAEGKTFRGVCHCGAVEFIVPIYSRYKKLLGFITVGSFQSNKKARINKFLKNHPYLEKEKFYDYFEGLPPLPDLNCDMINDAFGIAADSLGNMLYTESNVEQTYNSKEDIMLTRIISYIDESFTTPIKVEDIAETCKCSSSYVSHLFKKKTGSNIKAYTNWKRVEYAKELLANTTRTMTEIAQLTGFGDANYFTKVFSSFAKETPSEYKKSNCIKKQISN